MWPGAAAISAEQRCRSTRHKTMGKHISAASPFNFGDCARNSDGSREGEKEREESLKVVDKVGWEGKERRRNGHDIVWTLTRAYSRGVCAFSMTCRVEVN